MVRQAFAFAGALALLLLATDVSSTVPPPGTGATPSGPVAGRALSFAERLRARRLLDAEYHRHSPGTHAAFENAVPVSVSAARVEESLRQSVALDWIWGAPVTAAAMRAEIDRMTHATRRPDLLAGLFAALGADPLLIAECLAKPVLVNREIRRHFAFDDRIHAGSRGEATALRAAVVGAVLSPRSPHPRRREIAIGVVPGGSGRTPGEDRPAVRVDRRGFDRRREEWARWPAGIGPLVETESGFRFEVLLELRPARARVARFVVPKISWDHWWSETRERFDPADATTLFAANQGAGNPAAFDQNAGRPPAAEADPAGVCLADLWTPTSESGVPEGREGPAAVWTGTHLIVWGGFSDRDLETGAMYDPATDTWMPTTTVGAPSPRSYHSAVWSGSEMIVWGGFDGSELATGARYNPLLDSWTKMTAIDAPSGRDSHTAVWTGSEMIVWGGIEGFLSPSRTGGRYDPAADTWGTVTTAEAPGRRTGHSAVWTGSEMVVWGGSDGGYLATGGRYDPATDSWLPVPVINTPSAREGQTSVWTGDRMIVWGGYGGTYQQTGGLYDPVAGTWEAVPTEGAPSPRATHSAVWTGGEMVVWGGYGGSFLDTGGRFNPIASIWAPTGAAGAPVPRWSHVAAWTGMGMVVWGGSDGAPLDSGGIWLPGTLRDGDGDGSVCLVDCNDLDPGAWAAPGEVRSLGFVAGGTTLTWIPPAEPGALTLVYDVIRSGNPADFLGSTTCVESDDGADTLATDLSIPEFDRGFFYLVRAANLCPAGEGSLGRGSDGNPRPGRTCP